VKRFHTAAADSVTQLPILDRIRAEIQPLRGRQLLLGRVYSRAGRVGIAAIDLEHGIRDRQERRGKGKREVLWPWNRLTAWRYVRAAMEQAGLSGAQASAKGSAARLQGGSRLGRYSA